ncbi:mannose-1-phosphate guanylyltransferase [Candidatus Fermentibacterales bacterium]|nr:mannose-1-phosphate guanylyltransferase [Candidatus Fermentibacterales bacterium]
MSDTAVVIMAGGRGTRFWPASTVTRPKQFLALTSGGEKTLLRETIERSLLLTGAGNVYVVSGMDHEARVREICSPEIPADNILLEPAGRNTAACIGWAATVLRSRSGGGSPPVMVVLPSDHRVEPVEEFVRTVRSAVDTAADGWLVTIGVPPSRPATGYGYLEMGEPVSPVAFRVERFREKPPLEEAERMCRAGSFLWNAGMFVWRTDRILEEIEAHIPVLGSGLSRLEDPGWTPEAVYEALPSVSVDYGVMEKAARVALVRASFDWDDLGDWPSARRAGVTRGESLLVDSKDVTVWCEDGSLTVVLGVSGISVVRTGGVTLVMSDSDSQRLREIVRAIEETRPDLV